MKMENLTFERALLMRGGKTISWEKSPPVLSFSFWWHHC